MTATTEANTNPRPAEPQPREGVAGERDEEDAPERHDTVTIAEFANQSGKSLRANRRS